MLEISVIPNIEIHVVMWGFVCTDRDRTGCTIRNAPTITSMHTVIVLSESTSSGVVSAVPCGARAERSER
jgi:hypothetical protein